MRTSHQASRGEAAAGVALIGAAVVVLLAAVGYRDIGGGTAPANAAGWLGLALVAPVALLLGSATRLVVAVPAALAMVVTLEVQESHLNPLVVVLAVGPLLIGTLLRDSRRLATILDARGRQLNAERELYAGEAVRAERARIARELHDVVAHCLSVLVVQAAAGGRLVAHHPGLVAEAVASVTSSAQQAADEVDRLVAILADPATSAPISALIEELVARAAITGLPVTARLGGQLDGLPMPIARTLQRVVQEAVTNALKHAPGAPLELEVIGGTEAVVTVTNGPAAPGPLHSAGGGHGLAGMAARITELGGHVYAGPTPEGGWRVVARVPVTGP